MESNSVSSVKVKLSRALCVLLFCNWDISGSRWRWLHLGSRRSFSWAFSCPRSLGKDCLLCVSSWWFCCVEEWLRYLLRVFLVFPVSLSCGTGLCMYLLRWRQVAGGETVKSRSVCLWEGHKWSKKSKLTCVHVCFVSRGHKESPWLLSCESRSFKPYLSLNMFSNNMGFPNCKSSY